MVDDWGFCLFLNHQINSKATWTSLKPLRIKLSNQGLRIDRYDLNRPWGGFFVLDENQAQAFADIYFEGLDVGPCASQEN